MVDALTCIICFLPYDLVSRIPKGFPCMHTICLVCANELCQQADRRTFRCPTCRQPVSIPRRGASGLPTNLAVQNIVEIVQKTAACSTSHPSCPTHPSKTITNVCMECEVGLCSRCIASSSMKEHSSHEVLDLEDATEKIKDRISTLTKKGKKACQLLNAEFQAVQAKFQAIQAESRALQGKKAAIESCSSDLASCF